VNQTDPATGVPATTKVIIYPAALCPGDESFDGLLKWVSSGGKLLLTGDFGYNSDRKHTRPDRLQKLAGVEWLATNYSPDERAKQNAGPMVKVRPAGARVLALAPSGDPALTRYDLDKGVVCFFSDPLELSQDQDDKPLRDLYAWFLKETGIAPVSIAPNDSDIHVMQVSTRTGIAHVLFNYRTGQASREITLDTRAGKITLKTKDRYPSVAAINDDKQVTILGAYQSAKVGDDEILQADGQVTAVSLDGLDLRRSEAIMLLPFSEGRVTLNSSQRAWRRPVLLLGDLSDGRFRVLETLSAPPGKAVSLDFDADRATLFAVVCESDAASKWQDFVSTLASTPEEFPGY
jgi:hypothetical protein